MKIAKSQNIFIDFRFIGKGVSKTFDKSRFSPYFGLVRTLQREKGIVMVKEFPKGKEWLLDNSALRVSLDMTFDVPEEIAEQLELWGLNIFETCEYDPTCRRLKMSASTTLYRKGHNGMKQKRLLPLFLCLCLLFVLPVKVSAADNSEQETSAAYLREQGIMVGDGNGEMNLDSGLTRPSWPQS